ncbi:MAG: DUF6266 family protein [Ginsengibacter sp.]
MKPYTGTTPFNTSESSTSLIETINRNHKNINSIKYRTILSKRVATNEHQKYNDCFKSFLGPGFSEKKFFGYENISKNFERKERAIIHQAMVGSYTQSGSLYPRVLKPKSPLACVENANVSLSSDGGILLKWRDNSGSGTAKENDKLIIITYFPATNKMIYTLHTATRVSCRASLRINDMKGHTVKAWIGFLSEDEQEAGDVMYVGKVNL